MYILTMDEKIMLKLIISSSFIFSDMVARTNEMHRARSWTAWIITCLLPLFQQTISANIFDFYIKIPLQIYNKIPTIDNLRGHVPPSCFIDPPVSHKWSLKIIVKVGRWRESSELVTVSGHLDDLFARVGRIGGHWSWPPELVVKGGHLVVIIKIGC